MARRNLNDLLAFVTVAREGSFTRAGARLGVSQSALSQAIGQLEARLGIRLLARTTRSMSPTAAGERLLLTIGHRIDEIETELEALTEMRDKPVGSVRITCTDHALRNILMPRLSPLLHEYPETKLEFDINYGLRDIVADRFDAGVRLGDYVDKDMVALPISMPMRMIPVAAPAYFRDNPPPSVPGELTAHRCINYRSPGSGALYAWEFEREGRRMSVRVDGPLTLNTSEHILDAALAGFGIAFLLEDECRAHIESGRLQPALEDWCQPFSGYHLYYPSRRQISPAFRLVIEALRLHHRP